MQKGKDNFFYIFNFWQLWPDATFDKVKKNNNNSLGRVQS